MVKRTKESNHWLDSEEEEVIETRNREEEVNLIGVREFEV